jgi:plastocyanin
LIALGFSTGSELTGESKSASISFPFTSPLLISSDINILNYTVSIKPSVNTAENFSLSVQTPEGISASFFPDQISVSSDSSVNSTLQISASNSTGPGSYEITLIVSGKNSTFSTMEKVDVIKYLVVTVGTQFIPQNLTVDQGSQVTWLRLNGALSQTDDGSHDVDFSSGTSYVSPTLNQYASWSFIFNATGNYAYYCKFHPFMTGNIDVEPPT